MKYRPEIGREIAVYDLVIAVCDLIILYRIPQEPQTFFLLYHTHMGPTKNPWKFG